MAFNMIPYDSRNVKAVGYDPENEVLRVQYKHPGKDKPDTYDYYEVDQKVYETFLEAPSKGSYIATVIRPGRLVSPVDENEDAAVPYDKEETDAVD